MSFLGMYPNRYIGGNPYLLGGGMINGGLYGSNHPNSVLSGNVNYFTGAPVTASIPVANSIAPNSYVQTQPLNEKAQNVADSFTPADFSSQLASLQNSFNETNSKQGAIGKFWNDVKNTTGLGLGSKKCQKYINDFSQGKISYEEALKNLNKYSAKQTGMVNMVAGFASSALAVALAAPTGGLSLTTLLTGVAVGAGAKAGIKTLDRATNKVQGDTLDAKQILKDGLSGGLNGAVTISTMGLGKGLLKPAESAKEAFKYGAIAGAEVGAVSGAAQGAGDYAIECAVEKDEKFDAGQMVSNTAYSALTGGILGGIIGGVSNASAFKKANPEPVKGDSPEVKGDSPEVKADGPEVKTGEPDAKVETGADTGVDTKLDTKVDTPEVKAEPETTQSENTLAGKVDEVGADDVIVTKDGAEGIDTKTVDTKADTKLDTKAKEPPSTKDNFDDLGGVKNENEIIDVEYKEVPNQDGTGDLAQNNKTGDIELEIQSDLTPETVDTQLQDTQELLAQMDEKIVEAERFNAQTDGFLREYAERNEELDKEITELLKSLQETCDEIAIETDLGAMNAGGSNAEAALNPVKTEAPNPVTTETPNPVKTETPNQPKTEAPKSQNSEKAKSYTPKPPRKVSETERLKENFARMVENGKNPSVIETETSSNVRNNAANMMSTKNNPPKKQGFFKRLFKKD